MICRSERKDLGKYATSSSVLDFGNFSQKFLFKTNLCFKIFRPKVRIIQNYVFNYLKKRN